MTMAQSTQKQKKDIESSELDKSNSGELINLPVPKRTRLSGVKKKQKKWFQPKVDTWVQVAGES